MMKARIPIIVLLALGVTSVAWAQQPVQLKFSRVVDLTIPIESNMPGIPGIKTYADNPSKVDVVTAMTEAQKSQLQTEGLTLNSNLAVNGRAMLKSTALFLYGESSRGCETRPSLDRAGTSVGEETAMSYADTE